MLPGIVVTRPAPGPAEPVGNDESGVTRMVDAAEAARAFLRALERLPAYTGVVFHGLPAIPRLAPARWTRGVTATSKDPRIATENFSTPAVAAIVSRTGRDIGQFSAHPAEQEIVLPPEVVLLEVARTFLPDGRPVVIIEQLAEQDPSASLPPTLDALVDHVRQRLQNGLKAREAPITTRGKFVEPFFFLNEE